MEDEVVGRTDHGDRFSLTFYFDSEEIWQAVRDAYRQSLRSDRYMDSRKLALTVLPEGALKDGI